MPRVTLAFGIGDSVKILPMNGRRGWVKQITHPDASRILYYTTWNGVGEEQPGADYFTADQLEEWTAEAAPQPAISGPTPPANEAPDPKLEPTAAPASMQE